MSLKSRITRLARQEANIVVRNETAIRDLKQSQCNISGKIRKVEQTSEGIICTIDMPDGSSITANAAGTGRPLGPGSVVIVVNGLILA